MTAERPLVNRTEPVGDPEPRTDAWKTWLAVAALVAGLAYLLARPEAGEGFAVLSSAFLALIWAAVWFAAALGAGWPVMRWLAAGRTREWQDIAIASIAGGGVLVAFGFLLSLAGWFRPMPLTIVLVLCAMAGVVALIRDPVALPRLDVWMLPLVAISGVALMVAATVSPFYDQWHQHLGFTWIWINDGSVHSLPRNWYSYMPVNSSLLFAYGLGTLGPWSAQVVHWWSGVVTLLAVAGLVQRVDPRAGSACAVWILATSPTMLHLATTAGSELVITMFTAGAWLALFQLRDVDGPKWRWWAFAGACVGLTVGTKYIALGTVVIPIVIGVVVLYRPWRDPQSSREMITGGAVATAAGLISYAPWGIRNFVETGNPLFPFVNGIFRGILKVPVETAERFDLWMSGLDVSKRHLIAGLDLGTFRHSLDGFPSIGIGFLGLAAVVLVTWRRLPRPAAPALTSAILVGCAFWMVTKHANRYLVPMMVLACVVIGIAVAKTLRETTGAVRTALIVLLGVVFSWNLGASVSSLGMERLGCSFGVFPVESILFRLVSSSPAFEPVAAMPEDTKILLVAESRALGFERPVELEHPFGEPRLEELARVSRDALEMARRLAEEGFTHIFTNSWEAPRIAGINRRETYFGRADPETFKRLDRFSRECLDPVWADRGLGIYRIDVRCAAPPPGAGDLATW